MSFRGCSAHENAQIIQVLFAGPDDPWIYNGFWQLNPTPKTNSHRAGTLCTKVIPLEKETC